MVRQSSLNRKIDFRISEEDYQWLRDKAYEKSSKKKKVYISEIVRDTIHNAILSENIKDAFHKRKLDIRPIDQINLNEIMEEK